MNFNNYIIIIPARMGSTRLKNKPMIEINGLPLILHVLRSAKKINLNIPILVATDSVIIKNLVINDGSDAVLTNPKHESGSDRIFEALEKYDKENQYNKIIHLQGDLPNVSSSLVKDLASVIHSDTSMATPVVRALKNEINDENIVKCAVSFQKTSPRKGDIGKAIYFSRSKIPWGTKLIWHHLGLYAWDRKILKKFISLKTTYLEKTEKLEQLRALESNINIKVLVTNERPIGIDTDYDLKKFKNSLKI